MMTKLFQRLRFMAMAALVAAALPGCVSLAPSSNDAKQTSPMGNWEVSGKIGITTPNESVAGFIQWQQREHEFNVYVSGPMAMGNIRIKGNPDKISITQNGKTTSGLNPQRFIYEQLGWFFPVQNLPFWVKGQASPYSKAAITKSDKGQIQQINQDNWQVAYPRYNAYYGQPSRIVIEQGKWKFLIVIKNWSFNS
ncbi:MAG: outer membrane lipoprotein LolB [Crocinitomicaceae bacterium]|jgi:outer membrane lipoprotein LolB